MGALTALIGLQLIGMLSAFMGNPAFAASLFRADLFLGIGLFSAMTAYDTHQAIQMYEEANADHLQCSLSFYLNFVNILVRILQLYRDQD
jgi:FtsH-binding integral membrane protein